MPENEKDPIVDGVGDEPVVIQPAEGDQEARAKAAIEADPGTGGAGGEGAKSMADALSEGIEASAQHGKKAADKPAGEVDGKDGEKAEDGKQETDEEKAAREKAEKDEADKKVDHVNDPVDERLSERTQERIKSLIGYVKERDEALIVQGNIIDAIQDTGTTAEQFAETVSFLRNVNSDDPAALEAAYQSLKAGMRTLSIRMGKPVPEVDLLADYPELANAVKYGQITEAHAQEMATYREQQKLAATVRTRANDAAKTTKDAADEKSAAITELNALGADLAKKDPLYQAKFDLITGPLKAAFANIRPSQWKATFIAAYAAAVVAAPVKAAPAPAPAPKKGQPIRPQQPAGDGAKKAPGSMLDAISSAIEGM
jgi:hypothetical protein